MMKESKTNLVIRRVSPGSVFKFSLLLYLSLYIVAVVAAIILWSVSSSTGLRANVESLIGDLFYAGNFRLKGGQLLRAALLGGAVVVGMGAGANLLMTVLYNLISDVVGGVRVTVEERPDVARQPPPPPKAEPRDRARPRAGAKALSRPEAPVVLARRRESRGP